MPLDRAAFDRTAVNLAAGVPLNLRMIGDIFGQEFWELLILAQTNIHITPDKNITITINAGDK